jgi:hypothetical protein
MPPDSFPRPVHPGRDASFVLASAVSSSRVQPVKRPRRYGVSNNSALRACCLLFALAIVGTSGRAAASAATRSKLGPAIPGLRKSVQGITNPSAQIDAEKVNVRSQRFGGRVQRDTLNRWVVDGSVIGLEAVNIAPGQDSVFDTTLPSGLTPLELRGRYVVPSTGVASNLEVGVSGDAGVQVSSDGDRAFVAPTHFAVLPGSSTEYVEFTARSQIAGSCSAVQPSQIDRVQVVAGGTPVAPSMLADFFPVFLDRLIVRIDATASASSESSQRPTSPGSARLAASASSKGIDESIAQTVLRLTTFVVKRWPAARVVVTDKAVAMTPYDRQIAIRVGPKGFVALEDLGGQSTLVLSGSKSHLPALAEYLASPALEIAFARSVQTEGKKPVVPELGHVLTIGDLRGHALSAKGYGTVDQAVTVTQSQLGGQAQSIAVKITGVAQVAGSGRLVVQLRANDQVLASKRVLNDEPFTLKGTISRAALARDNVIVVRASEISSGSAAAPQQASDDTSPITTNCGKGRPEVTVQLDSGSQFAATMGRGLPAGFDRFPQAFVSGFDVRFTRLQLGDLQAATDVVQLLQGLSAPRLSPKAFGPDRKHSASRPMLYVGTPSNELADLDAPIVPDASVRVGELPISALQGFAATGDDHLVLVTNGSSANVASMLAGLKADLLGWRSLRGDVLVKQNGRVRNIRVRTSLGSGEEKGRTVRHSRLGEAMRLGLGLGAALALFGVLLSRLFGRRRA